MDKTQFSKVLDNMHYHYLQLNWYKGILDNTITEINELLKKIDD